MSHGVAQHGLSRQFQSKLSLFAPLALVLVDREIPDEPASDGQAAGCELTFRTQLSPAECIQVLWTSRRSLQGCATKHAHVLQTSTVQEFADSVFK